MKNVQTYLLTFILMLSIALSGAAQCIDDTHSPFEDQGWLSCTTTTSPNTIRGNHHWIMYDLGYPYTIDSMVVWNYNQWGETGSGVNEVIIDYSLDGEEWLESGTYAFAKAPGSWKYTGTPGPSLDGIEARYILLTVLSTWDNLSTCAGLSEVKFVLGEETTSTNDPALSVDIQVSPNPVLDFVNVTLKEGSRADAVRLYSATGQKLYEVLSPQGTVTTFNMSEMAAGAYFINVLSDGTVTSRPIVKVD